MTQLIYLRRQFKDAAAAYQSATAERERFAKQKWLSRTAWDRLGYAVRDGETSGIVLVFSTPRGAEPYTAYHASQVELRPGVWRKMVRCCPNVPVSLSREQRIPMTLLACIQTVCSNRMRGGFSRTVTSSQSSETVFSTGEYRACRRNPDGRVESMTVSCQDDAVRWSTQFKET